MSSSDSRRGLAVGLVILSSLMISFGGVVVRNIHSTDPWLLAYYRNGALGSVALIALIWFSRSGIVHQFRAIGIIGVMASVCLVIAGLTFLQSLMHTTIANTLFTLSSIPFFTAGLAWLFLREQLKPITMITMCIAVAGIVIMVQGGLTTGYVYGNLMALVTAFSFAIYAVLLRRNRDVNMQPALVLSSLMIMGVCYVMLKGQMQISTSDMLLCFLWGGGLSGIGNLMFLVAARHLPAGEITLYMLIEFSLGPIWVWLFVGEQPNGSTLYGGSMVLLAVAVRGVLELRSSRIRNQ
ncbi:MAG: drug/metabolite transporter (DMT)-like permease [Parasphingorhabdus sp.]|jgi:drug/metabolite transporter (DMT)-like permease